MGFFPDCGLVGSKLKTVQSSTSKFKDLLREEKNVSERELCVDCGNELRSSFSYFLLSHLSLLERASDFFFFKPEFNLIYIIH